MNEIQDEPAAGAAAPRQAVRPGSVLRAMQAAAAELPTLGAGKPEGSPAPFSDFDAKPAPSATAAAKAAPPATPTAGSTKAVAAPHAQAKVELEHEGGRLARIVLTCGCGERTVLACDYDDAAAAPDSPASPAPETEP